MRHAFRAASLSCAILLAPGSARLGYAEVSESGKRATAFRHELGLRSAPDVDAAAIAVRQSLFKRTVPSVPNSSGNLRNDPEVRRAIPLPARPTLPPRPLPAAPSPRPEIVPRHLPSEALRELDVQPTSFTPYDRYMTGARSVFEQTGGFPPTLSVACRLVEVGRAFRYVSCDPYRPNPPDLTAQRRAGDCKSKALWLYKQLNDPTALYVIGKVERLAKTSHAWLYWRWQGRWWILDPTTRSAPVAVDSVPAGRYVPYYSFGRDGAYRHKATRIFGAEERTPAVATKRFLFFPTAQPSASRADSR